MKKTAGKIFYLLLFTWLKLKMAFYRTMNLNRPKVLIYTDSRGHEITRLSNKHNPFSGYSSRFIKHYRTTAFIVPEKHTTLYDFLDFMDKNNTDYRGIICHVGVVCFAPRPQSQFLAVLQLKKEKIVRLFGQEIYNKILSQPTMPQSFMGEPTNSLVPEWLIPLIAERLNRIGNLIWISCNPVVAEWKGNYKERPENLGIVNEKSILMIKGIPNAHVIDLTGLNEQEVKKYTCDNVHLTHAGMEYVGQQLETVLSALETHK